VFLDGGRSEWLDDWADEDALDRLLVRLAIPGSAPDGVSSVLDPSSAAALRYLLVDAYDFVVRRRTADSPKDEYQSVFDAVKGMEAKLAGMTSGVETHGLIR
jgi:hypothetical protein